MFLAIDVGNTTILYGAMDEEKIFFSSQLSTDLHKTSDEYAVIFRELLHIHGISTKEIEGGIIASVVPSLKKKLSDAVWSITGRRCMIVGPGLKNGLRIRIDDPAELGSDQVCDAVAAMQEYPQPTLIFDMGTATTVSVIGANGDFLGGMIIPGPLLSLEALTSQTSQLPQVSIEEKTKNIIGRNTIDCMKNGVVYGTASMIDGIIARMQEELSERPTAVATGEVAELIVPMCRQKVIYDKNLLLKGLRAIYLRNRKTREPREVK